jgi:hypothetical protein
VIYIFHHAIKISFIHALLFASLCSLCLCGESQAEPYQVKVVLNFGDHRVFTKDFREQVQREIHDGLQAALGDMGQVDVVNNHALVKTLRTRGMKALDELDNALGTLNKPDAVKKSPLLKDLEPEALRGLAEWKRLDPTKTYFVFIDYVNDQYEIQVRQHDGSTGVNSPLREPQRIADRAFVARAATLLMARDFGVVGSITSPTLNDSRQVQVTFVGGDQDESLENWVKKGDLLALVIVDANAPTRPSTMIPHAFLQVQGNPVKGIATCQLLVQEGREKGIPLQTVRCIKLGTTRGPLRLRLLKDDARIPTPEPKVQLQVGSQSFKDEKRELGTTDKDGRFSTESKGIIYDHVAFVGIYVNSQLLTQLPIPILEEGFHDSRVNLKPNRLAQITFSINLWNQRTIEKKSLAVVQLETLFAASPKDRQSTMRKAQEGLSRLNDDISRLESDKKTLASQLSKESPSGVPQPLAVLLSQGDARLADLGKARDRLVKFIKDQEEIIKELNNPERKEILELAQKAEAFENQEEFGQALEVYRELQEKIKAKGLDNPKLIEHIDNLAKTWEIKGDDHRKARSFIYNTWPKLDYSGSKADLDGFKAHVERAKKALETCRKADDHLTALRLSKATDQLHGKLQQRRTNLLPTVKQNVEDAEAVTNLDSIIKEIDSLLSDINAYFEEKKSSRK